MDDDDESDVDSYKDASEDLYLDEGAAFSEHERRPGDDSDDDMSWEEALPEPSQARGHAQEQHHQQGLHAHPLQQQLRQKQEAKQQTAQQHLRQQRQQIEEQRCQQQTMAQTMPRQAATTSTQEPCGLTIGDQGSRRQPVLPQGSSSVSPSSSSTSARFMDPINASDTKISPTDRNEYKHFPSLHPQGGANVRMGAQSSDDNSPTENDKTEELGGISSRLFDPRKDKHKEKSTNGSIDISKSVEVCRSETGWPSHHTESSGDPLTPPQRGSALKSASHSVSQHSSSLLQRDREHQMLYRQQYPSRSPASSLGTRPLIQICPVNSGQASIASTLSSASDDPHSRPESPLVGENIDRDGSNLIPESNIIRVFAGKKLQTDAAFEAVLLNSSTSSEELVKQAMQRFRLPTGKDATDYCLIIKRIEGPSAVLHPDEKPLVIFETFFKADLDLPKLKRSSVGSISSIANNLSQHSAIRKLPMDDFTDETPVKLYLTKRSELASDEGGMMERDTAINHEFVLGDGEADSDGVRLNPRPHNISTVGVTVPSEHICGPSFHFALQLLIYPDDLPDGMVFDPLSEVIVFKNALRDRTHVAASSAHFRRRTIMFPKDVTVYEVIEIGLERFGIPDGVVDDSDEVEGKTPNGRGSSRVRYVLSILVDGKGRWRHFTDRFSCSLSLIYSRARTDAL